MSKVYKIHDHYIKLDSIISISKIYCFKQLMMDTVDSYSFEITLINANNNIPISNKGDETLTKSERQNLIDCWTREMEIINE